MACKRIGSNENGMGRSELRGEVTQLADDAARTHQPLESHRRQGRQAGAQNLLARGGSSEFEPRRELSTLRDERQPYSEGRLGADTIR